MCLLEFELGVLVVIELPELPAVGVMAHGAAGAETSLVFVIRFVTADAVALGLLVDGRQMAVLAGHGGMHANEWEMTHVVIEHHPLAPAGLAVTLLALITLLIPKEPKIYFQKDSSDP